ncbi:MAG: VWA domain-containing protein [Planctomycetota bacterium]
MTRHLYAITVSVLTVAAAPAPAGTGTFRQLPDDSHVLDFCISVQFDATAAQLDRIRTVAEGASDLLADVTDGALRFGNVSIIDESGASSEAEIWILPEEGVANAIDGFYGVRDAHVVEFYPNNFDTALLKEPPAEPSPIERYFYTMVHEMAHSLWRILDESTGPNCCQVRPLADIWCENQNVCDCEPWPGAEDASFCIMDNYYIRGGNAGILPTGTGIYTLNELCTAANHDPDGDSWQDTQNGQSCWETIESHTLRPLQLAGALPDDTPPNVPGPTFDALVGESRYVFCLDRSGSMDNTDTGDGASRLDRAKQGIHFIINGFRGGDRVATTAYATDPEVIYPLALIDPNDEVASKQAAKDSVTLLDSQCCTTATGLGISTALGELTPLTPSCNQPIVLMTDGFTNDGPSELDFIEDLVDAHVPVSTLAIGEEPKTDVLIELSRRTGGNHYHVVLDSDIPKLSSYIFADNAGASVIAPRRGHTTGANPAPIPVDALAGEVTFLFSWNNLDTVFSFGLLGPGGQFIDEFSAAADPDVDYFDGLNQKVFRVRNIDPGDWDFTQVVLGGGHTTYDFIGIAASPAITMTAMALEHLTPCGELDARIEIVASPMLHGRPLADVSVTGTVTHPDGLVEAVTLQDDGAATSGDLEAGDGEYTVLVAPTLAGTYTFELVGTSALASTAPGDAIVETSGDLDAVLTAPFFVRSEIATAVAVPSETAGDIDGDGGVGILDFLLLLAGWGMCPTGAPCAADLDCDGTVGILDFLTMLANWG